MAVKNMPIAGSMNHPDRVNALQKIKPNHTNMTPTMLIEYDPVRVAISAVRTAVSAATVQRVYVEEVNKHD
jgi:hypothetical protein